ncbi:sigma-54 interaction domain-containing protein [Tissierella carlieri]|uniref:sigma-54 interaction domain-containing protein n=1 Tax=Tissierella carlieri TaxID=689904 RepID=UPI002804B696|nr:sigma 54-interacting transcriptional regulator [uncultured Tissierella sp.]MDU5080648.1 sigma 54-interacting transcriptional regulator [Bacillota bacterium]
MFAEEGLHLRISDILDSSYDGIYITDGRANTIMVNKAYERIAGIKIEELIGRNMNDLVNEGYISQSATLLVLKDRKVNTIEQNFKTGKKALVTSTPVFNSAGDITMVVTNVRDITELYELKEKLDEKENLTKKYSVELEAMKIELLKNNDLIAMDKKMLDIIQMAIRVAPIDTTVLITGETGVGKEEIAKLIYKNSNRETKQFIKVNCGSIPKTLIEAELFGYERGAFTGANKEGKIGLFEVADGGTIFLDEIGELPLDMQVKLLRVLQDGQFTRVGGVEEITVDVRILAATNRNLEEMVREKLFREDLYYRLNIVPITIPPLRDRRDDIIPLIHYFLNKLNKKYRFKKTISSEALKILYAYEWKGNVRELRNIIERIMVMSEKDIISKPDLPKSILAWDKVQNVINENEIVPLKQALNKVEKHLLEIAFNTYGNVRDAAKVLEIDPATFVRKRQKYR